MALTLAYPSRTSDFTVAPNPPLVGSPAVGQPNVDPMQQGQTPFRMATLERTENVGQTQLVQTTSEQQVEVQIPGTGFVYGFDLYANMVTAANAATVVYTEDAPYSSLSSVVYKDVNGELVNVTGFHLELAARYCGWKTYNQETSLDVGVFLKTAGSGATGGSFTFHLYVPLGLNRRQLIGILGNQDRAQAYTVRHNWAASGQVYSTPPTTLGTMTVVRIYESYAVPNAINDTGRANQIVPGHYGTLPYITQNVSEAAPLGGATVNHFMRRIGNVIRCIILVLRQNGSRTSAEGNLPTSITLKIGNETLFTEPWQYRRQLMFNRYGFDAPAGVLVYDWIHDFVGRAGWEIGNDWIWSQNLNQVQFILVYPAGFGSTGNSLTFITADMIVPPGANVYGF